jgi:tripartite-type tricarboxylate transporter receptor subunit TctC
MAEAIGDSPDEFAAQIRSDTVRWGGIVRSAGVHLD